MPATRDQAVREGAGIMARGLVALIATLRNQIAGLDRRIAELVASHPEAPLFDSLPGAGKALVPRMIVAFGTRRERFDSAQEMQRYSGIAPVTVASGKTQQVSFRRACPKFLRQTFHEFALHSIAQWEWARAYYDHLRNDEKKGHHAAVRSLAYKWIRIIYRCWKDGKPYDEQIYLRSLRRNGSLLGATLALATQAGWKSVAGFQTLSENNA
jgi:transposase